MKKLLFLAFLALITFSCRTVKQTSTAKTDVKTAANLDVKQSVNNQSKVDSFGITIDKSITNSLVSEVITVTNLSKPDSVGKQYPVQTTVINRTTDNKKVADIKKSVVSSKKSVVNNKLSDKSTLKSDIKTAAKGTTITEMKTPAWVYVAVIITLLALIGVVYAVLKRFGIIK